MNDSNVLERFEVKGTPYLNALRSKVPPILSATLESKFHSVLFYN